MNSSVIVNSLLSQWLFSVFFTCLEIPLVPHPRKTRDSLTDSGARTSWGSQIWRPDSQETAAGCERAVRSTLQLTPPYRVSCSRGSLPICLGLSHPLSFSRYWFSFLTVTRRPADAVCMYVCVRMEGQDARSVAVAVSLRTCCLSLTVTFLLTFCSTRKNNKKSALCPPQRNHIQLNQ